LSVGSYAFSAAGELRDWVEIDNGQRIVIHVKADGVGPALDAGASLVASVRRQEDEGR
jgi:hypothetical protein